MTSRHRAPAALALDHLIVAAATLGAGVEWVEQRLGVHAEPGGRHAAMGTHNALVAIGPSAYLEIIAIDPECAAPSRPRFFDLDEPRMRARLAEGPALIHWTVRSRNLDFDCTRAGAHAGPAIAMQRGDFRWRITVPDDGHLPEGGLLPTLIEWQSECHPSDALPASGVELVALAGEHPEPAPVRVALASLGLSETLKVTYGRTARLAAMMRTRRGVVTL